MVSWVLTGFLLTASASIAPQGVVVITVDTLRADHLGFMGAETPETPSLDRLARRGATFRAAFSAAPTTAPAHASLFTGRYPSNHGVGRFNGRYRLTEDTPTLARRAQEHGVATAAVVSNPVLGRGLGLNQGFDRYDDELEGRELNRESRERIAEVAVDKALAELERLSEVGRFLLWLHLQDPHGPYDPPEARPTTEEIASSLVLPVGKDHSGDGAIPAYQVLGDERRVDAYRARYRAEIAYLDRQLRRLLERIEHDNRFARTLVVFTADHGEAMGEDGFFFAHGHSAGAEQLHVPLVFAGGGIEAGLQIEDAVSTVALHATLLDYFEVPAAKVQVGSLLPLLRGETSNATEPVFGESHSQIAVASGRSWLQRDREEAQGEGFFRRPQRDGSGSWRALPRVFSGDDPEDEQRLGGLLDTFESTSREANEQWAGRRVRQRRGARDLERLRALGYLK